MRLLLVVLVITGCAKPKSPEAPKPPEGCYYDGCNMCCKSAPGLYGCTLLGCIEEVP